MFKYLLTAAAVAIITQNSYALECSGTEPFWTATLTKNNIGLVDPTAFTKVNMKVTKVEKAAGMAEEFLQVYLKGRVPVATVRTTGDCSDGMSDNVYPQEVVIFRGYDSPLYGCCGQPTGTR